MLIFITKQEYVYNRPQSYTEELSKVNHDTEWYNDKKTKLQLNRYYFDKNKLIKWIVEIMQIYPLINLNLLIGNHHYGQKPIILMKQLKPE